MMGNSDIHAPDLRKKSAPDDHRTMTLVFAKERTLVALKQALVEGRTAVWFNDQIIGRKELLQPLFTQCIRVGKPHVRYRNTVSLEIQNVCDVDIKLQRTGKQGPPLLTLPARTTSLVKINLATPDQAATLAYTATNFLIAPDEGLPVTLEIPAP